MKPTIALMGYGAEAACAVRYFSELYPDAEYLVYDTSPLPPQNLPAGARYEIDNGTGTMKVDADIVVRTPSFDPKRIHTNGTVTSVTNEFFNVCPVPIIGVTGTKGKGTTASFIQAALEAAGVRSWLVGNIGLPALDVIDEIRTAADNQERAVVVYELSSFQLWDLTQSPHVAVVLMIEEEHLDIHSDKDEYITAKSNIARYQTTADCTVYFADNAISTQAAHLSRGRQLPFTVAEGEWIIARDQPIIKKAELGLRGEHNYQNATAALTAAMEYVSDVSVLAEAARSFKGLPHRLEVCAITKSGVTYVNDSYSSAPPATIAAVRAFEQQSEIVIVGGKDRGLAFDDLAETLKASSSIKRVIVVGEARSRIAQTFDAHQFSNYEVIDATSLQTIVERARNIATEGDVVILSPGCASFDMFDNFTDRGQQFKAITGAL